MKNYFLFYLGILFSSLDSFSIFSGISLYSPYFSVLFFVAYLISNFRCFRLRFTFRKFIVLVSIVFTYLYSLFAGIYIYGELKGFIVFFTQLTIAILLYKSFNIFFKSLSPENYIKLFPTIFIKYSLPILFIGLLEIALISIPSIYTSFISIFSSRVTLNRIQLISGEPSWASRYLLIIIALIPLTLYTDRKKQILLIISIMLTLATGSALGILTIAFYFFISYFKKRYLKYIVYISVFMVIFGSSIYNSLDSYTKARLELLTELTHTGVEMVAVSAGSGSVMARLGNPLLGIYVGQDNPIVGVGGGYYYKYHNTYLNKYFPLAATSIDNIYETGSTPKNLISRIFAETGFIGLSCLVCAIIWLYLKRVRKNKQLYGVFIAMILLTINFDNLFHIFPLLLFCYIMNIPTNQCKIKC